MEGGQLGAVVALYCRYPGTSTFVKESLYTVEIIILIQKRNQKNPS